LERLPRTHERVFVRPPSARHPQAGRPLNDRQLLGAIKRLCKKCGFPDHDKYKVHTFRHAFASMCARNHVSYKYALDCMGHKSSDILDMYVTLFDDAADSAIKLIDYSAAQATGTGPAASSPNGPAAARSTEISSS
jgi:integrase